MHWDDLRFVLMVARHGSFTAAARKLEVTQPTVGRRIAALERQLGAKLFERHSGGFVLSSSGAQVVAHAERMDQDALAAERSVRGRDEGVRGTVRITASEWLVTGVLPSLLAPLLAEHSELVVELLADTRHLNLAQREADIALRPRRFEHDAVVQRATTKLGFALYASRAYLDQRGTPSPGDGSGHALIAMAIDVGDVARSWLEASLPRATVVARTNGRDAMRTLATSGVGLACLARVMGDDTPELKRVALPDPPVPTLWMGVHRDTQSTPRVRTVGDHLAQQLRELQPRLCP